MSELATIIYLTQRNPKHILHLPKKIYKHYSDFPLWYEKELSIKKE